MRVTQRDTLPEGMDYSDDGCDYAPKCLECPLPACRYDNPLKGDVMGTFGGTLPELYERDLRIAAEHRPGDKEHSQQLADEYNVSLRTVYRIAQRGGPSGQVRRIVEEMGDTERGKPTSAIGSPIKARKPLPVIPANRRSA